MFLFKKLFSVVDEAGDKIKTLEKIEPLYSYILEECKRQSYTIDEFEQLVMYLGVIAHNEKEKAYDKSILFQGD